MPRAASRSATEVHGEIRHLRRPVHLQPCAGALRQARHLGQADFLFSPYSSGLTATAAIISEQYGKIMITTGAAEGKTYTLGNQYLFQMYTPADHYLASALDAAKSKDPQRQGRADLLQRRLLPGGRQGRQGPRGRRSACRSSSTSPTTRPPPTSARSSTRSCPRARRSLIGGGHFADGSTLARQLRRAEDEHEDDLPAGGAGRPEVRRPGRRGPRRVGAVPVGAPGGLHARLRAHAGRVHRRRTRRASASCPGYHAAGGYAAGLVLQHAIEQAGQPGHRQGGRGAQRRWTRPSSTAT